MKRTGPANRTGKSAKRRASTPPRRYRVPGDVYFDEVRGKTVEDVHVSVDAESSLVTLSFTDKTELTLGISTGIQVEAMLESWKTGNSRVLKRWGKIFTTEATEERRGKPKKQLAADLR